jgi:protease-4
MIMRRFIIGLLQKALVLVVGYVLLLVVGLVFLWYTLQSFERKPTPIQTGSVLVIDLGLDVPDAPRHANLSELVGEALGSGQRIRSVPLRHFVETLRMAREDERIEAVVLHGNFQPIGYGSGFAAIEELRDELLAFAAVGKPVTAYLDRPGLRELFLSSAAEQVWLHPYSELNLSGMSITTPFFTEALDRLGVNIQTLRAGAYKSALEPFTERQLSPENRAQLETLINDLWQHVQQAIVSGRQLPAHTELARGGLRESGIYFPSQAVDAGLVDGLLYMDQLLDSLQLSGAGARPQVTLERYLGEWEAAVEQANEDNNHSAIAVVYLEGDLVDEGGRSGWVDADSFARELRRLQRRENVAAVVIRVNSPGGSATAAEKLHREIARLAESRPVVVSFGSIAASGGYWLATPANQIVMSPAGLTGSIGVFGLTLNVDAAAERMGIGFETVRTDPFADITSIVRPRSENEMAILQTFVDILYNDFLQRVESGRGLRRADVEAVAEGRVFMAPYAVERGLGDRLGGLHTAIEQAALLANLSDGNWQIIEIPAKEPPVVSLMRLLDGDDQRLARLAKILPGDTHQPWVESAQRLMETLSRSQSVQARLPFDWFPQ